MWDAALLVWSLLAFLAFALAATAALLGSRHLTSLRDVPPWTGPVFPRVSIVVAARDEATHIEAAVRSLLALDWPNLEIDVVDDRSTDGTGAILGRLARGDPPLKVVRVTALPGGWLGKNHALQVGARRATGDWILFTD